MTYPEYDSLTLSALQAEFLRLAPIYVDASNRRTALSDLIEKRKADAWARVKFNTLSSDDKDALRLVLVLDETR